MENVQLTNGLRVVLEKIPTCRSVSFGIWVKTGSRNEDETTNGVSHFIEHMLFKGTERYDAKSIAEAFDGIGGHVNAFTSKEYTCYYTKVLDEHLPIAVDVLSDMFFRSQMAEEELHKERNVILEEISMYEDTPDDLVHDLLTRAAYGSHSLAYPILGTRERLDAMTSADLKRYMNQHYTLDNTVIAVAGNIDDSIIELLERHFGDFQIKGQSPAVEAPAFKSDLLFHQKQTEQNHICMSLPGCSMNDSNLYAMVLLNNIIGGGMSSRLFQEIREKRGLAYSVYSYHSSHIDSGLFTVYAGTAPKQTSDVLELTLEVLQDVTVKGLSDEELRKGKEQLKGSLILSLESTSSRMTRLGKNELMLGRHYTLDEIIARIEAVTQDDVREIVKNMTAQPFAVSMVGSNDAAIAAFRRDSLVQ
ncbi:M16 family metallopeptidase [Paenibacillus agilis]|uniref:Insulinase family protein n=1 Tax=Paenibacillus agilis TaxID=3020863 RepID=A0A559J222_9BACL|nr:pitrilysin family protein [Paenibacillus agilis]TVX93932.1 insulinase family protein [Paenibacillus agilis]